MRINVASRSELQKHTSVSLLFAFALPDAALQECTEID